MSKYTTEVRYICETCAGLTESVGYDDLNTVVSKARTKIFDFDYPIFDEDYKSTLETKILKHYYTREIGVETVGLWKHFLDVKMNEIMPYYNQLYKSALLEFDPFGDVDYTREGKNTAKGESKDSGKDTRNGKNEPKGSVWTLYSDTPQGSVAGINAAEPSVGSDAYLTNATHVISDATGSKDESTINYGKVNNSTNEGEYFEKIKGKMNGKSYSQLLTELRKTFLNIDVMIINDLSDLFFNIY